MDWQPITLAPAGEVVMTKIDDGRGVRNEQALKRNGSLWWYPDGSIYVYYTPTHWRRMTPVERLAEIDREIAAAQHWGAKLTALNEERAALQRALSE